MDPDKKSQSEKDICVNNSEAKKRPSISDKKPSVESKKESVLEKESVIVSESITRKGCDSKSQSLTRKNTTSESPTKKQSVAKKVSVSGKEHLSRENTVTLAESSGNSKYESFSNKDSSISEIELAVEPFKQTENQNAKVDQQKHERNENVKLNNTFDEELNLTLSEEEAAIRIQSIVRGHLTRASMKVPDGIPECSTKKEELGEEPNADKKVEQAPKETNVVEAASTVRKSKLMETKSDEASLEALAENKVDSESHDDLEKAAVKIQSNFRGHQARKEVEIIKSNSTKNVAEPGKDNETAQQEVETAIDDSHESEKSEKVAEEETKPEKKTLIAQKVAEGEPTPVEPGSSKDLSEANSNDEQGQEKASEEIEKKTEELPKVEAVLTQAPAVELVCDINSTNVRTKKKSAVEGEVENIVEQKSDKVESEPEVVEKSSLGVDVAEQSTNVTAPTPEEPADNKSREEQILAQQLSVGQINTEEPAAVTESITDSIVKYPATEVSTTERTANTATEEGTYKTEGSLAKVVKSVTTGDSSADQSTEEPAAQPLAMEDLTTKEKTKEPQTVGQLVETEVKAEQSAPHPPKIGDEVKQPTETAADPLVAEPETVAENKDDVINDYQQQQTEKNIDIEENNTNMEAETFDETVSGIEKNDS